MPPSSLSLATGIVTQFWLEWSPCSVFCLWRSRWIQVSRRKVWSPWRLLDGAGPWPSSIPIGQLYVWIKIYHKKIQSPRHTTICARNDSDGSFCHDYVTSESQGPSLVLSSHFHQQKLKLKINQNKQNDSLPLHLPSPANPVHCTLIHSYWRSPQTLKSPTTDR